MGRAASLTHLLTTTENLFVLGGVARSTCPPPSPRVLPGAPDSFKLTALTDRPQEIEGTDYVRPAYVQGREDVNAAKWRKEIGRFGTKDYFQFLLNDRLLARYLKP